MSKKANVTISRHRGDKDYMSITITDVSTGLRVVEVEMELDAFADCITGLAFAPAVFRFVANKYGAERFGKQKIAEEVFCDRPKTYGKDIQRDTVRDHFHKHYSPDGWELWDDGTGSQQNGDKHRYTICKYVDEETDRCGGGKV